MEQVATRAASSPKDPAPAKRKKKDKFILKTLQRHQRAYKALLEENAYYRSKEQALFETVAAAEHSLHFVGTVLAWQQTDEDAGGLSQQVAEALVADLRAHELMSGLGSLGSRAPRELTFVERCLHAAVTPARIQEMRGLSLQQLAERLTGLTRRVQACSSGGGSSTATTEQMEALQRAIEDYTEFVLLLHIAQDSCCLQLCLLRLDTMEEQQAPGSWWQQVARDLQLLPQQAERLAAAWDVFSAKRAPLVQWLQELASEVHLLLQPLGPDQPAAAAAATSSHAASTVLRSTPLAAAQQQPVAVSSSSSAVRNAQLEQQLSSLTVQQLGQASLESGLPEMAQRSASSATRTSSSSSLSGQPEEGRAYPGALDLEQTDRLHEHLQKMMELTRQLRELGRNLVFLSINTFNPQQAAILITRSWPWFPQPTMVCEHVAQQYKDFTTRAMPEPRRAP